MRNVILILVFLVFSSTQVYAHPGRTASDGCHYCRTNCDKWGEAWNQRHCHGENVIPSQPYVPPVTPTYSTPSPKVSKPTPTVAPSVVKTNSSQNNDDNWLGWLLVAGGVGMLGYFFGTNKK